MSPRGKHAGDLELPTKPRLAAWSAMVLLAACWQVRATDPYPSTYQRYPGEPTLITQVTIFDGEGGRLDDASILFADGEVVALGKDIAAPAGARVIDGRGKWVTPGIIDAHSHLGALSSPQVKASADLNEMTNANTAQAWVEHSVWPQDPAFARALANGGVTALQILPGSSNLFGGRSVVLKNVPARTVQQMKFPGAPYGLKMACGENPKKRYTTSRMGNVAITRQAWAKAAEYKREWDGYRDRGGTPPKRDLQLDTLMGVLAGEILVHHHCFRADEMAQMLDLSREFGYRITAFHHAVEAYKIADLLRDSSVCAVVFSDWWGGKLEMRDAIDENLPLLENASACAMIHSDNAMLIQRLNQEVAKALAAGRRAGLEISDERAWTWLSINPAKVLGIADRTGSLRPGKMADIVLWNGHPFSVYTRPEKVWIDGALLFDALDPGRQPISDFDLRERAGRPDSVGRRRTFP
ncbi:amidohydrolase [Luteimonas sp. R10]|uniref:amidohydrolase n=1 Tax=Luteimonas sp. R10 TaxID=3108176 RepID=UPI003087860A|nr:amidohydrolase [Luteimonas sp. R10]